MNKRKVLPNLLLTVFAFIVAFAMAEAFLHFFHPIKFRQPPDKRPNDTWRELLHQPSPVPGLAYELTANREKLRDGVLVKTNNFGMRDDEPSPVQDGSVRRIAVLGDSFTFGFGVAGEHTYANVLERLLNQNATNEHFEVLNFGVGGYATRDEALVFEHKALAWQPELAIIGYVFNDPQIDPVQPLHAYFQEPTWWQYSNVLRLVASAKRFWDIQRYGAGDYFRYLHAKDLKYWQSVVAAFTRISEVAETNNIPVLLVIFPRTSQIGPDYSYQDIHQQIAQTAKGRNIQVLDLLDSFMPHTRQALMVKPDDAHPSELGHEIAAGAIYEWLGQNGYLR